MTVHSEPPSPLKITGPLTSVFASAGLLAALQLELFTSLGEDALTSEELASRMGVGSRRLSALLNVLVHLDLLRHDDGLYRNGDESSFFLIKGKPSYIGGNHELFSDLYRAVLCTAASLREDRPAAAHDFGAMSNEELGAFFRGLHGLGVAQGRELAHRGNWAQFDRLADVGGGSGNIAIGACQTCPNLRATVLELGRVVPIARQFIREADLDHRIEAIECDVTQSAPPVVYDAAVLRNFLQVLSPSDAGRAIHNVVKSVRSGGAIYIIGFVLDDAKRVPWEAVAYDVVFLNIYADGRSYTDSQYRDWLQSAGCTDIERRLMRNNMSLLTARVS